jgi:dynein heavy chain 2, cytosolic
MLWKMYQSKQARQLGASGLFEPFTAVAPLRYNPYTEPQWRAAVAEFERCLAPIEQTVAANFKCVLSLL